MIIRSDLVHCPSLGVLEILHDHILVIDEQGFITHVGPASEKASLQHLQREPVDVSLNGPGTFLVPTFCDLHLHAPQYLYQGTGLHLPLMEWLDMYAYKAEESIDADPVLARTVYTRLSERLLENGTGAVVLFGTIKEETNLILAEAMQGAGIRAYIGKLSMDISSRETYTEGSVEASLSSAESFVNKCNALEELRSSSTRLIEPILTPRFVPTCSNELLRGLGNLSQAKCLRIQSHMAESHDQVQWVRKERGKEDMDVFESTGLLTSRTIQAHCTFLDPPSLAHVSTRGTSIAHCPLSNSYFSAKPFPLREAISAKVKVGLGTDIAGGYSADIMSAMRQAVIVSRMREGTRVVREGEASRSEESLAVNWIEALFLATKGGAIAMGLRPGIGNFEVGAPFDAQRIRIRYPDNGGGVGALDFLDDPTAAFSLTQEHIEKWCCLGDVRNREEVWVQGSKVWQMS